MTKRQRATVESGNTLSLMFAPMRLPRRVPSYDLILTRAIPSTDHTPCVTTFARGPFGGAPAQSRESRGIPTATPGAFRDSAVSGNWKPDQTHPTGRVTHKSQGVPIKGGHPTMNQPGVLLKAWTAGLEVIWWLSTYPLQEPEVRIPKPKAGPKKGFSCGKKKN